MPEKKSDLIKIYIVIGLSLVLLIVGYFRLLYKKRPHDPNPSAGVSHAVEFKLSQLEPKHRQNGPQGGWLLDEPLRPVERDIFEPLISWKHAKPPRVVENPRTATPTLKLSGTIVGGERPIAIINNQLIRLGDWIEGFKVVKIGKTEVLLDSGISKIVVELVKNE